MDLATFLEIWLIGSPNNKTFFYILIIVIKKLFRYFFIQHDTSFPKNWDIVKFKVGYNFHFDTIEALMQFRFWRKWV